MLSVIIPVYNVEAYLRQCMDSVLAQTLAEMQIILVDDGSTDHSGHICDEYAGKDPRVCVLHKKNGGLMSAWKHGLTHATGEWIGFVDSDDWVEADMFETMLRQGESTGADLVMAALIREYDDRSEKEKIFVQPGFYDRERMEKEIFPVAISMGTMLDRGISPNRGTKLYRKSLLLENLHYCDERISLGEDMVTTFACLCDARSVCVMDFYPYHYRLRGTSIMGKFNIAFTEQSVLLNETVEQIAKEKNVFDFSQQLDNDMISLVYYGFERNLAFRDKKASHIISYMKESMRHPRVRRTLETERLSDNSKKCAIYKLLYRVLGTWALYLFIRYVVLFKRKHFS